MASHYILVECLPTGAALRASSESALGFLCHQTLAFPLSGSHVSCTQSLPAILITLQASRRQQKLGCEACWPAFKDRTCPSLREAARSLSISQGQLWCQAEQAIIQVPFFGAADWAFRDPVTGRSS